MIGNLIILAIIFFGGISGYRSRSLSSTGALAAVFVGISVLIGFGGKGLFMLGLFFVSSSYWSKYKSSAKEEIEEKLAKGATRDWRQVFANGGTAAVISIINYFYPDPIWLIGFLVCLASSNSDTWASEIGSLSKQKPIYIRTFKRIETGTSGAISLLGSTAAILGSLLIAIVSTWLFKLNLFYFTIVFLAGFCGNLIDTIFGAFYQQVYKCSQCGIETEKRTHCDTPTNRIKGFRLVDNDMVNFLSGFLAALFAMLIVLLVTK